MKECYPHVRKLGEKYVLSSNVTGCLCLCLNCFWFGVFSFNLCKKILGYAFFSICISCLLIQKFKEVAGLLFERQLKCSCSLISKEPTTSINLVQIWVCLWCHSCLGNSANHGSYFSLKRENSLLSDMQT